MKLKLGLLVALSCVFNYSQAQWQQTSGLYGGHITAMTTNGVNIFAGTVSAGIYSSNNNGNNWTVVNNGLYTNSILAIATNGTNIFAGTDGASIMIRSVNNGSSWNTCTNGLPSSVGVVSSIVISGTTIFAGSNAGVFMSTNNGNSWSAVNNGLTNTSIISLVISGTNILAGTEGGGVFISINNGTSWTAINNGLTNLNVTSIALCGTNIFAGTYNGMFLSTNNGTNWNAVNNGLVNTFITKIAVCGTSIFAGTSSGIYTSSNLGTSWFEVNNGLPNTYISSIAVSGTNVFVGTYNKGIFISNNNGINWNSSNNGLTNTGISSMVNIGTNTFAASEYSGLFLSTNNGYNWTSMINDSSSNWIFRSLAVRGTDVFVGIWNCGILLSSNNGNSWTTVNNGLTSNAVSSFLVDGTNIYAGMNTGGICLSTNNGNNWTSMNTGLPNNESVNAIVKSGSNIFAGTANSGVFLSTNNGNSWTAVNNGLTNLQVESIAICGTNIFIGTRYGGVFLSSNNGINWTSKNNGLTNTNVSSFAVNGENIFAGTGGGIFLSRNNGENWIQVNTGLPGLTHHFITSLKIVGSNLLAGTPYRGLWIRPLSEMINLTIVNPKILLNSSIIIASQNITISGMNFIANGTAKITMEGPAGFSDIINVNTSTTGSFTKIYTTTTAMPVGNYTVSAKDSISGLTTVFKSFTIKASSPSSYLQFLLDPGTTFNVSSKGELMFEFKDKMVLGNNYPKVGSERLYSYNIELSDNGGNTWTMLGNLSNQEIINQWVLLPYFVTITSPGTNYKIKITDTYKPSNFIISPVFSASPTVNTGNLKVQLKWDFSYPNPGTPINGICADGTARIYLDLSKINTNLGSPISNVSVAIDDGGVNTGKEKLGKVMAAINTTSYSSEANGISSLTASNNTPNLSEYYFWYVAPDDFVGNDPADESSSNRRVIATFTVTYSDGTSETITKPIIIVRPPLMLVHGLGGNPSTWDNFRENLFGNTWNFINDFKFKTVVPVSIDPSASFALNAYKITGGNTNDLNNSMPGVINQMRQKGYASVKVDYIGHSMGGSVLRYALDHYSNVYKRTGTSANLPFKNYETGYLNKVITIGTPHTGSPWANIINRYVGDISLYTRNFVLKPWYQGSNYFDMAHFPFYFIKPIDEQAWIWNYEPTPAVMDLRLNNNGGIQFSSSNVKAHLIAGDIFPGEQFNLPGGVIPNEIIDAIHNTGGDYLDRFLNCLYDVAKIKESDPILRPIIDLIAYNIPPVNRALTFMNNLSMAMDVGNMEVFIPESDIVVSVGSQLAGYSRTVPNITVIDNVAHSSPMPNKETNNLQIGNTVMQLLNDPISSNKFAGFPNNSNKYISPKIQPLSLPNPYFSVRDTNMLKLLQPADSLSFAVDTNLNVRVKLKDTLGLKTLNVYFQGKTYPINDFSSSDIILNLQINSNELNLCKLVVEGYYNYSDSAKLVFDERFLNIITNDSLVGFTADPDLIQLAINQITFADYTAQFVHFNSPVKSNDPNLTIALGDSNIVAIDYVTRGFKGKSQGQTLAVVTYGGIVDTIYFNVTGCIGGVVNILSANTSICSGDTLSLTADNGIHFEWSTGDTTQATKIYAGGTYSVLATTIDGCLAISSVSIIQSEKCNSIEGTVTYDNNQNIPLQNTKISLFQNGLKLKETYSGTNGFFAFDSLSAGVYEIKCLSQKLWGGVNAIDALLVLKHFAGLSFLSGLPLKAADVNKSGYVNSVDALLLAKRFTKITNSFITGDWLFNIDTINVFGNTTIHININGLCYGDVNRSYQPANCNSPITTAIAGNDQLITSDTTTLLVANSVELDEIGTWSILSGNGGQIVNDHDPFSVFTGIVGESYKLEWRIINNCEFSADTVTVSFIGEPLCGASTISYGGQIYHTVQIGTQCWMKENLNVGSMIDGFSQQINNNTIEKYCYNNDTAYCTIYGGLYQWDEMMNYSTTSGSQGICPLGFHIPTELEWESLELYLGGGGIAGGKMKEVGYAHWNYPNTGATNESGFTAIGAGVYLTGYFYDMNYYTSFWSSSEDNISKAWSIMTGYYGTYTDHYYPHVKTNGYSIRCVK